MTWMNIERDKEEIVNILQGKLIQGVIVGTDDITLLLSDGSSMYFSGSQDGEMLIEKKEYWLASL